MDFNGQPLGGPINLKLTFSDTRLWQLISAHETSAHHVSFSKSYTVIYLEDGGGWLHDAINELQADFVRFPKGFSGFFDIFIKPAFHTFWLFGKGTGKDRNNNVNVWGIC